MNGNDPQLFNTYVAAFDRTFADPKYQAKAWELSQKFGLRANETAYDFFTRLELQINESGTDITHPIAAGMLIKHLQARLPNNLVTSAEAAYASQQTTQRATAQMNYADGLYRDPRAFEARLRMINREWTYQEFKNLIVAADQHLRAEVHDKVNVGNMPKYFPRGGSSPATTTTATTATPRARPASGTRDSPMVVGAATVDPVRDEKRRKGMCFKCPEKWAPGHKCATTPTPQPKTAGGVIPVDKRKAWARFLVAQKEMTEDEYKNETGEDF